MKKKKQWMLIGSICLSLMLVLVIAFAAPPAEGKAAKEIRIGVLQDLTGAFAPAGGLAEYRSSKLLIDTINKRGGILGEWKIIPFYADSQSSPDVAIREAERMITAHKVVAVTGFYSSALATPVAPLVEKYKTIMWNVGAISPKILKGRHQKYVFQPQVNSYKFDETVALIAHSYKELGFASPAEIKGAIFYEDGPYGTSTGAAIAAKMKKVGMPIVYNAGYAHDIMDLTPVILKLKAFGADVLFHVGYYPDIVLFLKQARELGLKWKALLGHGAGYADMPVIAGAVGKELVNYVFNIDPPASQYLDPKTLTPEVNEAIAVFKKGLLELYREKDPRTHYSMGYGNLWILLEKVLPLAIKKYGEVTPDTIRKAALEIDIPDGGTPMGYGAKFLPPDHEYAGYNERAFTAVFQYVDDKWEISWPLAIRTIKPVLPLPPGHVFAK
ncbi:MAG: ABC transporter substrate-binding protein [Thermodesulfobacteriota bacterium]|nr:ABC transporter substrate-binding protein [Thermodesulfobacteriota bacterium]